MRKGAIYTQKLRWDDPEFLKKATVIQSNNYLHDQTRSDKDRLITICLFVISLGLTLLVSIFEGSLRLILFITTIIFLIIILVLSGIEYLLRRKIFWKNREKMKKTFETIKLEWKEDSELSIINFINKLFSNKNMSKRKFFSNSIMNGATFFGVGITVLGISFALDFIGYKALIFAVVGYLYLITSFFAFVIPSLSE
jgi:hypothetical protein